MTTETAPNCLYVSRLTRNVNNDHLSEIFGSYGNVVRVEVSVDRRNGLSKGTAVVQFANPKDAENALIYLNGGQIDGNVIEVSDKVLNHNSERVKGHTTGRQVVQHDGNVERKKGKGGNQKAAETPKPVEGRVELGKRSRASRSRSRNGQRDTGASSVPAEDGRAAKKYVPKDRAQDVEPRQARQSRSRDRNNVADTGRRGAAPVVGTRVPARDSERGARADSRDRTRGNVGREVGGGAGRGAPGRRPDSRDRGLSRYGPASGPAPADRRGGNSRDAGIYGPSGASGPPARGGAGGRGRPGEARYVPIDRTRGRSRSRSLVRGGIRRADDVRRVGRSRSPARGGRSPPRQRSMSYSRSRSRSRSSESGYRRRVRRSYSSSSSSRSRSWGRSGGYRRSRSYSRSTRSSRSPSRSRSVSRSHSYSRSPSRSRSVSVSRSRSRSPAHSAHSRSASK